MPYYPPIEFKKSPELREILIEDTSIFFTYVFFSDQPLQEKFCYDVERCVKEIRKLNSKLSIYLAVDVININQEQKKSIFEIVKRLNLNLFDLNNIEYYTPFNTLQKMLEGKVRSIHLESLDRSKALVSGMANKNSFKNILCLDPDVVIRSNLYVKNNTTIAFTYSPMHKNPTILYDLEFSMIYVDAQRPKFKGKDIFDDYCEKYEAVMSGVDSNKSSFGSWTHSTIAVDPIIDFKKDEIKKILEDKDFELYLHQMIDGLPPFNFLKENFDKFFPSPTYLHPSIYCNDMVCETRTILANYANRKGDYIIHGDYFSDNQSTWKEANSVLK